MFLHIYNIDATTQSHNYTYLSLLLLHESSCSFGSVKRDKTSPSLSDLRPLSTSQNHPVPEAAEDQGAAAEGDGGLWTADGHVFQGKGGTNTKRGYRQ